MSSERRTPEITYPCSWVYQLIGPEEAEIHEAVAGLLGERPHTLERTRQSAGGRYVSLRLMLTVSEESDRIALYQALCASPAVKVVL